MNTFKLIFSFDKFHRSQLVHSIGVTCKSLVNSTYPLLCSVEEENGVNGCKTGEKQREEADGVSV